MASTQSKSGELKKIALVQGGMSSEREISLKTGQAFAKALDQLGYDYQVIDAGPNLPQQLLQVKPDVALLALHGKYAEDGTVQGICEYLKIPYSGSGVLASALCMNKSFTKQILFYNKIPTPAFDCLRPPNGHAWGPREWSEVKTNLSFPLVVKPSRDGSSMGISICRSPDDLPSSLAEAARYDSEVLLEEFIPGMELTVPILDERALTPIEIVPQQGFYDFQRKYTVGATEYHLPPRLSAPQIEELKDLALRTHQACQARVYSRVDFRLNPQGQAYVIEINTLPGCTATSLLPKAAAYEGIDFPQVIRILVEQAGLDYPAQDNEVNE